MEALSAHGRPVRVSWQGILLAASLLTVWTPPGTAEPTVEPEPPNAAEGQDVLLRVRGLPGYFGIYSWYKGGKVDSSQRIASYNVATQEFSNGPAHSGREIMYPNISLLFKNVTQADTGEYTLRYVNISQGLEEVAGQLLRVYPALPKPHITSNNSHPVEHKDPVVLTCGPETQDTTYLWSIRGQSPPDGASLQLSQDNRTLTLLRVTRTDTGPYVCETWNPLSAQRSDPLALNVLYGPDAPTISPSHDYYSTGANLSLSCHAASHPPAQYSWLVNGRPQQASQELSIHNITESDSGAYTCLAHNKATGLSSTTVKNITVSAGGDTTGLSVGVIAAIVTGVLAGVALAAALATILLRRRSERTSDKRGLPEPPASTPGSAPSVCSAYWAPQPDSKPVATIYEELLHPDTSIYCQINPVVEEAP